jgi:hypothetical protein
VVREEKQPSNADTSNGCGTANNSSGLDGKGLESGYARMVRPSLFADEMNTTWERKSNLIVQKERLSI